MTIEWDSKVIHSSRGDVVVWSAYRPLTRYHQAELLAVVSRDQVTGKWGACGPSGEHLTGIEQDPDLARVKLATENHFESEENMGDARAEQYWTLMREVLDIDDEIKPLKDERRKKLAMARELLKGGDEEDSRQLKLGAGANA